MKPTFRRAALAALAFAALAPTLALGQIKPLSSKPASGTVAVTDTFQSVFAYEPNRSSCLIQNNSASAKMYVFFGPIASATKATSIVLDAGKSVTCNSGPVVAIDQVSITGTATDAFYAAQQ